MCPPYHIPWSIPQLSISVHTHEDSAGYKKEMGKTTTAEKMPQIGTDQVLQAGAVFSSHRNTCVPVSESSRSLCGSTDTAHKPQGSPGEIIPSLLEEHFPKWNFILETQHKLIKSSTIQWLLITKANQMQACQSSVPLTSVLTLHVTAATGSRRAPETHAFICPHQVSQAEPELILRELSIITLYKAIRWPDPAILRFHPETSHLSLWAGAKCSSSPGLGATYQTLMPCTHHVLSLLMHHPGTTAHSLPVPSAAFMTGLFQFNIKA